MLSARRRVERDDRTLTHLLVCEPPTTVQKQGPHFGMAYLTLDASILRRLCDHIGRNTHLRDVCFDAPLGLCDGASTQPAVFKGLEKNKTIDSLGLSRCDLSTGVGREVLRAFGANKVAHIAKFAMWRCSISKDGAMALSSTLSGMSLVDLSLTSCHIDDDITRTLVHAVRGHPQLARIDLQDNDIGAGGCEALATLLEDPNCAALHTLELNGNKVDDDGVRALADGLVNNDTLETLCLDGNDDISLKGWNALTNVICNSSSIEATHASNHTLTKITSYGRVGYDDDGIIPQRLLSLVQLNGSSPFKRIVARRKILREHMTGDFSLAPFVDENMEWKVLPHALAWMARPSADGIGKSAVFDMLRGMPTLIGPSRSCEGVKEGPPNGECGVADEHGEVAKPERRRIKSRFGFVRGVVRRWKKSKSRVAKT